MHNLKLLTVGLLIMFFPKNITESTKATDTMAQPPTTITFQVTEIDVERGGNLMVFIFAKSGFPKNHKKALHQQTRTVDAPTMNFQFDLTEDEIAIKVLHDEDMDGKVTKNWTGVWPKEGLGFSNKQKISLAGPPGFQRSKIQKDQLSQIPPIAIRYPQKKKTK